MTPGTPVRLDDPDKLYHDCTGIHTGRSREGIAYQFKVKLDEPILLGQNLVRFVTVTRKHLKPIGKGDRQLLLDDLLAAIIRHKAQHDGNSPSLRWLRDECGLSSTSVTKEYLGQLEARGDIELSDDGRSRMITVTGGLWVAPGEAQP